MLRRYCSFGDNDDYFTNGDVTLYSGRDCCSMCLVSYNSYFSYKPDTKLSVKLHDAIEAITTALNIIGEGDG